MTKVSIIMPAFNAERFIEASISSVLRQTLTDFELIIVNDGSTDSTDDIIRRFERLDNRIKKISLTSSGGPANARNIGINIATGEYVAFIDSDDKWSEQKLEVQTSSMDRERLDMTYTLYRRCNSDMGKCSKPVRLPSVLDYKLMLINTGIAGCLTVVVRRSFIGTRRFPFVASEDFAFWLELLRDSGKAKLIPYDLGFYRTSSGSVSSNKIKMIRSVWNIYRNREKMGVKESSICICCYLLNAAKQRVLCVNNEILLQTTIFMNGVKF